MKTAIFTICAKNYLAHARTLHASVAEHEPGVDRWLFLSDRLDGAFREEDEPYEVVEASDLGIPEFDDMTFRYDVTELSTAIKPAAFLHLFGELGYDAVVYLDPDIWVLSPLVEVRELLAGATDAILTPHACAPIEDGDQPDDQSLLQAGAYNLGFLALRSSQETREFLEWWHRRLLRDCRVDLGDGLFVDQKWAELLPCYVARTHVLRHSGYNVAYWNLMHRGISQRDGQWLAEGLPLRFFHFSGVDFANPDVFSKHQQRYTARNIGSLRPLLDAYRRAVQTNGWNDVAALQYAYGVFEDGSPIHEMVRRIYRDVVAPDRAGGADLQREAVAHCNQAARTVQQDPEAPITHLMLRVWEGRGDLQAAFDLATVEGRAGFFGWWNHTAKRELGLDDRFVPVPRANGGDEPGRVGGTGSSTAPGAGAPRSLHARASIALLSNAYRAKRLYSHLPIPLRHRVKTALLRTGYERPGARARVSAARELATGAQLIGYPRAELGMGEHVRLSASALNAVKYPFSIYDFSANVAARQDDDRFVQFLRSDAPYKTSIYHINADQMPVAHDALGREFFEERFNIGYWAWELSEFPDAWTSSIEMVDEIWAPSRFVRDSIAKRTDRPVVWMPLAVQVDPPTDIGRKYFGLPDDRFIFYFSFDFASFATRKNPAAVLDAFANAFPAGDDRAMLVVKTMSLDWHAEDVEALRSRLERDKRIRLIPEVLDHREIAALAASCDCYVSLHRSEGFGRGMAESMHLGKPVIATGYSGNMDFMDEQSACLVDFSLVPVKDGEYPHCEGQVWADPDAEQASRWMRKLVDDPSFARSIGRRARRKLVSDFSPERVGHRMRDRLSELGLA